jgi:hypothetical protein
MASQAHETAAEAVAVRRVPKPLQPGDETCRYFPVDSVGGHMAGEATGDRSRHGLLLDPGQATRNLAPSFPLPPSRRQAP